MPSPIPPGRTPWWDVLPGPPRNSPAVPVFIARYHGLSISDTGDSHRNYVPQMDSPTPPTAVTRRRLMNNDDYAQLKHRVAQYRPLNPYILTAFRICLCTGACSSIIRAYSGWSYEEAGIWLNLGFWGGYLLVCLVLGPLVARATYRDWRFIRDVQKLKQQRAMRDLP